MSILRRLGSLPLLGMVACTTVYTYPNDKIPPEDPPPPTTPSPPSTHKIAFVTSAVYQGGYLGGLSGADAECGKLATAAGLTGTFKAWLSSNTSSAADRLTHSTVPYTLVDGTRVADDWADLIHAALRHPIDVDETGATLADPTDPTDPLRGGAVWTGTQFDGVAFTLKAAGADNDNCSGWTDLHEYGWIGDRTQNDDRWSITVGSPCTDMGGLYCLEQ